MTEQPDVETRKAALAVVARDMIAKALEEALHNENIGWEDYPDIREVDYEEAFGMAEKLAESMQATEEGYEAAYAHLVSLVDNRSEV